VVRHAVRVNGITELALTKLDILGSFKKIQIANGYRYGGKLIENFPASIKMQKEVKPVYESMDGWLQDINHVRKFRNLPKKARDYVNRLSRILDTRISLISVGTKREEIIKN
jgi:adenylosuccinate synthase